MYISSFDIPIVCKIEGGNIEDLKKSIAGKLSNIKLSQFPSLQKENAPLAAATVKQGQSKIKSHLLYHTAGEEANEKAN